MGYWFNYWRRSREPPGFLEGYSWDLSIFHSLGKIFSYILSSIHIQHLKEQPYLKKKKTPALSSPHIHTIWQYLAKLHIQQFPFQESFPKVALNRITKWHMPLFCSLKVGIMFWLSFNYELCLWGNKTIKMLLALTSVVYVWKKWHFDTLPFRNSRFKYLIN